MEVVAPPVVAVVVAHDPGPWFEECLASLGAQDYPNLSILVVDAASRQELRPRVADVLAGAYVTRLETNPGYAGAANVALRVVEGATHFLLCHDDVALEPDAVRLLVEEAYRSNAGLVTPKIVAWYDPGRLLEVGRSLDRLGLPVARVEPGERDQAQHDAVRDVFVASGAALLVRADLFGALGGFDGLMSLLGEDVDLSWRAQVAGARVVVAPAARVRHLEALRRGSRPAPSELLVGAGGRVESLGSLERRHLLRASLKNRDGWHTLRSLPALLVASGAEAAWASLGGQPERARAVIDAWRWNLRNLASLRVARRHLAALRRVSDGDVRRLQANSLQRLVRAALGRQGDRGLEGPGRGLRARPGTAAVVVVALVLVFGLRGLLFGHLPAVGEFGRWPTAGTLWAPFRTGWWDVGLGTAAPPPVGLLALAAFAAVVGTGVAARLLVAAALAAGVVGAWRASSRIVGVGGRAAAVAAWTALTVPYDALGRGEWTDAVLWGVAPVVVVLLAGVRRRERSGREGVGARSPRAFPVRGLLVAGLGVAALGGVAPGVVALVVVATVVLAAASLVAAPRRDALAVLGAGGLVVVVAWCADLVRTVWLLAHPSQVGGLFGLAGASSPGAGGLALLHLDLGPIGASPLTWAVVALALVPVVVDRGARRTQALGAWAGIATGVVLVWLAEVTHLGGPPAVVLAAPVGLLLALSAGLGTVTGWEALRSAHAPAWRRAGGGVALAALVAGCLPVLAAVGPGTFGLPAAGYAEALSWMPPTRTVGPYRVLWVGPAGDLPLSGWNLGDGLAYGLTTGPGLPAGVRWVPTPAGSAATLASDLRLAAADDSVELGHLIAPAAVRYVVVLSGRAPGRTTAGPTGRALGRLEAGLSRQIDLAEIPTEPTVEVLQNTSWYPAVSRVDRQLAALSQGSAAAVLDLPGGGWRRVTLRGGRVRAGTYLVARPDVAGWGLVSDGRSASGRPTLRPQPAFGDYQRYVVTRGGRLRLAYRAGPDRRALQWATVAVWVGALLAVGLRRRRRAAPVGGSESGAVVPDRALVVGVR